MAQIKPDDVWSVQVHDVQLIRGRPTQPHDVLACGAKIMHVYNMYRKRAWNTGDLSTNTFTYVPAFQQGV